MDIAKVDSMTKFSPEAYSKVAVESAKGLLRLLCFEPKQYVPLHKHPKGDEYFYVITGKGKIVAGTEEAEAEPGCIIKVPAGVPHQWRNSSQRLMLLSFLISPKSYEFADEATEMEPVHSIG